MVYKEDIETFLVHIRELENLAIQANEGTITASSFFEHAFERSNRLSLVLSEMELKRAERLEAQVKEQCVCIEGISARVKVEEQKLKALMLEKPIPKESVPVQSTSVVVEEKVVPEPALYPEVIPETLSQTKEKQWISLNERIEKKRLVDLWKSFSLNDRFLFRRELFGGNDAKMSKTIGDLNALSSFEEAISYIRELNWDPENEVVADFTSRLEKRFC
ncbi:MAG: hypothetical protein PHG27_09680 [Massilibacteroides sp.]|nr:hypothetical protein [Massilibacteroides sp.]